MSINDGTLEIQGANSSNPGELVMSDGTNSITVKPSTSLASDVDFFLPNNTGSSGQILTKTATGTEWATSTSVNRSNIWFIKDVKTSGTDGGTFTSGSLQTRDLNTLTKPSGTGTEVQLAVSPATTNQIRIEDGTYLVHVEAPGFDVDEHKCILYNVSDSTTELVGTSVTTINTLSVPSMIDGFLTVTSGPKVYEVRHQCVVSNAGDGFGAAAGFGVSEVYTVVSIIKL